MCVYPVIVITENQEYHLARWLVIVLFLDFEFL